MIAVTRVKSSSRIGRHLLNGPHTYTQASIRVANDIYSLTMAPFFVFRNEAFLFLEIKAGKGCECRMRAAEEDQESVLSAAEGYE